MQEDMQKINITILKAIIVINTETIGNNWEESGGWFFLFVCFAEYLYKNQRYNAVTALEEDNRYSQNRRGSFLSILNARTEMDFETFTLRTCIYCMRGEGWASIKCCYNFRKHWKHLSSSVPHRRKSMLHIYFQFSSCVLSQSLQVVFWSDTADHYHGPSPECFQEVPNYQPAKWLQIQFKRLLYFFFSPSFRRTSLLMAV